MQHNRLLNSLKHNHNNKWHKPLLVEQLMHRDRIQEMLPIKVQLMLGLPLLSNSQELKLGRSPRA